jgi:hypothetical protein
MQFKYFFACIVSLSIARPGNTHTVGLLINSAEPVETAAIIELADFTMIELHNSSSSIDLAVRYHDLTYLSVMRAVCELLESDVVAVVSASDSTLTEIQANLLSQYRIPLVAAVATNPFLSASSTSYLLRLSPSDIYQSQAIFDLLKEYGWVEFSILASADSYGISGVVHLQLLASRDSRFNVKDVQHFDVKRGDSEGEFDEPRNIYTKELQLIKDSLAKVIVLNCGGRFANRIFR